MEKLQAKGGFDQLISAAAEGGAAEIDVLWRAHHRPLLAWLRSVERLHADDLASETWVDALRSLSRFEGTEANFRSWLFAIARRRLIDFRRRQVRRQDLDDSGLTVTKSVDFAEHIADLDSAKTTIDRIAALLSPDQTEVVLLRILGGYSANQVAEILDKSPESIRALQHRGLNKLTKLLEPNDILSRLET